MEKEYKFTLESKKVQRMFRPAANDADAIVRTEQRLQAVAIDWIEFFGAKTKRHQQNQRFPVHVIVYGIHRFFTILPWGNGSSGLVRY